MEKKDDVKDSAYKDDPDAFGASSETAGGGTANHYDGSGPESGSTPKPSPSVQKGNNHGSQEDWREDDAGK
jgi:hypothetical protein